MRNNAYENLKAWVYEHCEGADELARAYIHCGVPAWEIYCDLRFGHDMEVDEAVNLINSIQDGYFKYWNGNEDFKDCEGLWEGMGVTRCGYSDRHPYEIIDVIDDRHIVVRELEHIRTDNYGMSDVQSYKYVSNEHNRPVTLFKDKKDQWREKYNGKLMSDRFVVGYARYYFDYSF